jgi:hypothetical protein
MWTITTGAVSVRIIAQEHTTTDGQIIAKLQPLGGGSVHHQFGYESPIHTVRGYVVGYKDSAWLRTLVSDGTEVSLVDGYMSSTTTSLYVKNTDRKRLNGIIGQTIDLGNNYDGTAKSCTDPVFEMTLELWKDEA